MMFLLLATGAFAPNVGALGPTVMAWPLILGLLPVIMTPLPLMSEGFTADKMVC
jgi:cell division protein FtsW (lipid II flippase)